MSSIQGKLKVYLLLVESLQRRSGQTAAELMDMLAEVGFNMSKRTFLRDIESLRYEYGINIPCNRSFDTYSIDESSSGNIDLFQKFLRSAVQAQFVADNIKSFKSISSYIQLSDTGMYKGLNLLQPLLEAIKTSKEISFIHVSYFKDKTTNFTVQPYLLKEYLNRWYVFAYVPDCKDFRIFGIDRIEKLEITKISFKPKANIDPKSFFENTMGVVYNESELQEVELRTNDLQAKYLRSQPLHSSQKEINTNLFQFFITPNYELKQRIMMMGSDVVVIKPLWLKNKIIDMLKETLEGYQNEADSY
jgi:predicted DNA-binding transcriptional regulator YafY